MAFNDAAGCSLRPQVMVSGYISNGAPGTMPPTHFRHMQLPSQTLTADSPLSRSRSRLRQPPLPYCLPHIFFFCCFPTNEVMLVHCRHLLVTFAKFVTSPRMHLSLNDLPVEFTGGFGVGSHQVCKCIPPNLYIITTWIKIATIVYNIYNMIYIL